MANFLDELKANLLRAAVSSPQAQLMFAQPNVSPQQPLETNANFLLRRGVEGAARLPAKAAGFVGKQLGGAARDLFDTPAAAAERARTTTVRSFSQNYNADRGPGGASDPRAASMFPNSFRDPFYGELEQTVGQRLGIPAQMLAAVRLAGERSNNDQVSSAGARTPYQFIPSTAAAIKQKYGIDVMRDPASAALGAGMLLKENLEAAGGDPLRAMRMYHGGRDPANWGPENAAYAQRTGQFLQNAMGLPLQVPFDAGYGQQALGTIQQGLQAASQPFSQDFQLPGLPAAPELVQAPKTDFSKADQIFAEAKPQNEPDDKRRRALQWQGIMGGLGQAMAALPDGAGLGKVLAALGGGMLAGRAAGEGRFDAEMERYQDKLSEYNRALAGHELGKATQLHQEAVQEAAMVNQRNWNVYAQEVQRFNALNNVQATSQGFQINSFDPKTGKGSSKFVPNAGMLAYQGALQQADVLASMGGQLNGALQGPTSVVNGLVGRMALQEYATSKAQASAGGETALLAGPMAQAGDIVKYGYGPQLFGDKWADVVKGAREQLLLENPDAMGQPKLATELMNNLLQGKIVEYLVKYGAKDPDFMQNWSQFAPMASGMAQSQMARDARTTRTQRSDGTTTVQQVFGGND